MLLDAGICIIYRSENAAPSGDMPKEAWAERSQHWYGELTVGVTRYRAALKDNERADLLLRIWRDRDIRTTDRCMVDGALYKINQVQHRTDEDGLLVTDLELERLEAPYEFTTNP